MALESGQGRNSLTSARESANARDDILRLTGRVSHKSPAEQIAAAVMALPKAVRYILRGFIILDNNDRYVSGTEYHASSTPYNNSGEQEQESQ